MDEIRFEFSEEEKKKGHSVESNLNKREDETKIKSNYGLDYKEKEEVSQSVKSIKEFIRFLYPLNFENGKIVITEFPTKKTKFFSLNRLAELEEYVINSLIEGKDIYFNMALQDEKKAKIERLNSKNGKRQWIERAFKELFPDEYRKSVIAKATLDEDGEKFNNQKIKEFKSKILSFKDMENRIVPLFNNNPNHFKKYLNDVAEYTRGKTLTARACYGVWLDIDVNVKGHHKDSKEQFQNFNDAYNFLMNLDIKPSVIVKSGGGFHVYYVLSETQIFENDEERKEFENLVKMFGLSVRKFAESVNGQGSIDTTFDLARMLRVPFTKNFKDKKNPKNVEIVYLSENKYSIEDLINFSIPNILEKKNKKVEKKKEYKIKIGDKVYTSQGITNNSLPNAELMYEQCNFIKYCVDNQNEVNYHEWLSMLQTVLYCEDGEYFAHEWSKEYDEYDDYEVDTYIEYLLDNYKPITCDRVCNELNFSGCNDCPFRDKVNSPISLGYKREKKN